MREGIIMKKIGKVLDINISEKKGIVKKPIEEGVFIEDFGLEGDIIEVL